MVLPEGVVSEGCSEVGAGPQSEELPSSDSPILEARSLSKAYGTIRALIDVSFALHRGEAVAIMGENGAGKSTFARILAGAIMPDIGEILLEGKPVDIHSPRDALAYGISYIPQELAYLPSLTVAENILIGQWPSWRGLVSQRAIEKRARVEAQRFGIELDVSRPMSDLRLAECQLVEIVKALAQRARILILDEPTASLSDHERQILFRFLGTLTKQGIGLVYISHRIDEIFRFGHRVDVLRNGRLVASLRCADTRPKQVIAHMLGRAGEELSSSHARIEREGEPILELIDWCSEGRAALRDVNMSVGRGEIVGLFGLRGCGSDLVAEGLAGLRPQLRGEMVVNGRRQRIFRNARAAHDARVIYMPPERQNDGLILGLSVQANISLGVLDRLSRLGVLNSSAEQSLANRLSDRLSIRIQTLQQRVSQLSGGNQQKVMLANRLAIEPQVLVLHEPTRGVDVGTRVEIHKFLRQLAVQGTAILWITSDVEEAVAASDRLLVMRDGGIVAELIGASKTQHQALSIAGTEAA